ncbi:hypothetical protein [Dongia sp.]|uniref:hypothetical protein n=1 Tax=Dongia sp. TaxID=1977262 RepID=UPI0037524ADE
MGHFLKTTSVAGCGLVTSLITAAIVALIEHYTGFGIFSFSLWFVIPVGAICTGIAAASGYYFGSLYFHIRPNALLLAQMVIVAGLTAILIYYVQYATLVLDDGRRVSDYLSFGDYLDIVLTSAHYRVGRALQADVGEVGDYGYALAALQFIGFLLGGFAIGGFLLGHPTCTKCGKYLRVLARSQKLFGGANEISAYRGALFSSPLNSPEFAELAKAKHKAKIVKGSWQMNLMVRGCSDCKSQTFSSNCQVFDGDNWKSVDELNQNALIPDDVDLRHVFRA